MSFPGFQKKIKEGNFDVFVHEFHGANDFCCFFKTGKIGNNLQFAVKSDRPIIAGVIWKHCFTNGKQTTAVVLEKRNFESGKKVLR